MTTPTSDPQAVENHLFHCQQYMDNALEALGKGEPGKAGEMLWGSFAQALHAVDAWRGPVIQDHRGLMNFAARIRREIGDQTFTLSVVAARSLHHNFYIPVETVEEVEELLPSIQQAIAQILALLPDDARNGTEAK